MGPSVKTFGTAHLAAEYADIQIRCGETVFKVHRVVVCSRSKVLARECDGAFKADASTTLEHTTFEAPIFEAMLDYMYSDDYPMHSSDYAASRTEGSTESSNTIPGLLQFQVQMYAIADFYLMPELKALALKKFSNPTLQIDADEITEIARAVYACTSPKDPLREECLKLALDGVAELLQSDSIMHEIAEDAMLQAFAVALLENTFGNSRELQQELDTITMSLRVRDEELDETKKQNVDLQGQLNAVKSALEMQVKDLANIQNAQQSSATTNAKLLKQLDAETAKSAKLEQALREQKTRTESLAREVEENLQITSHAQASALQAHAKAATAQQEATKAQQEMRRTFADLIKARSETSNNTTQKDLYIQQLQQDLKQQQKRLTHALEGAVDLSLEVEECRQCGDENTWWLGLDGMERLMLRCGHCRTRHYGK